EARAVGRALDGLDREILALLERRAELRGERVDLVRALLDGRLERFDLELEHAPLAVDLLGQEVALDPGLTRGDPGALALRALHRGLALLGELLELGFVVCVLRPLLGDLLLAIGPRLVLGLHELLVLALPRLALLLVRVGLGLAPLAEIVLVLFSFAL